MDAKQESRKKQRSLFLEAALGLPGFRLLVSCGVSCSFKCSLTLGGFLLVQSVTRFLSNSCVRIPVHRPRALHRVIQG